MRTYYGKFNILNTYISACSTEYLLSAITNSIQKKKSLVIAPVATHPIIEAVLNPGYAKILNSFHLVIPDSFYLKFSLQFLYNIKLKKRAYGPDLFIKICEFCEKESFLILIFGNYTDTVKKKLLNIFPALRIDCMDVTNKPITDSEISQLGKKIKNINPQVVILGVGSPKQHYIAHKLTSMNKPILAVGAAFSFIAGRASQAPVWTGNYGLEWLYRLFMEPRRLWKRYLIYGPLFMVLIIKQRIQMVKNKSFTIL